MKNRLVVLVGILSLMWVSGCAHGITQYVPKDRGNDYCSVIIMRSNNPFGAGSSTAIILNKRIIAYLWAGEYFAFPLKPGTHSLAVNAGAYNTPELNYDFEPYCKRFFLVSPSWSSMIEIEEIGEGEGLKIMKNYKKLTEEIK
jgi:hypothetical protein